MSMSTRSGCRPAACSRASSALAACPTTENPLTRRRTAAAAARKPRWSSTTSTRTSRLFMRTSVDPSEVRRQGATACGEGVLASLCRPGDRTVRRSAVAVAVQIDEDGGHPAVAIRLLAQAELAEDGVAVLLDGALGQEQQ